jgi:hypothetical protein
LVHWCYDLYPEAIAADGGAGVSGLFVPIAKAMMGQAYRTCDALVDLGPRMRERLSEYPSAAVRETLVPWALAEPGDAPRPPIPSTRNTMFGDAQLALLYSGTLGRAHEFAGFLRLARAARARHGDMFAFTFASRGHKVEDLRRALQVDDTNVRLIDFGDEANLARRLEAADVHMLSLRDEWSGLVVPSKFFGSLAVGRPVLYAGSADSDVARWIAELRVGWRMDSLDVAPSLDWLERLASSPAERAAIQRRARSTYDGSFRKQLVIDRWNRLLRSLVAQRVTQSIAATTSETR